MSGVWYLLGGAAIGATLGVLLAPKKGSETRNDLSEWSLRGRDKARGFWSRVSERIPTRVKLAAAGGAVKGGLGQAVSMGAEKAKGYVQP